MNPKLSCLGLLTWNDTLWNASKVSFLENPLGGDGGLVTDSNNSSQSVGVTYNKDKSVFHATQWNDDTTIDLGSPMGGDSYASAINNSGQVVGSSRTSNKYEIGRATLWHNRLAIDLNRFLEKSIANAGWILGGATDVNDNGWIVGGALNPYTHIYSNFVLIPTPKPDGYTLFLGSPGIMGFIARHRKNWQSNRLATTGR